MTMKHSVAAGLLLICALPVQPSAAQRRGVKARSAQRHSSERTPRRPPTSRCAMTVHQGLKFGGVTWDSAPGAIHNVEVNPVTGLRSMDIRSSTKGSRSMAGVIVVESESAVHITLSTPARLSAVQGHGAHVPFTGTWAVSESPTAAWPWSATRMMWRPARVPSAYMPAWADV